jgi:hypothetical protein
VTFKPSQVKAKVALLVISSILEGIQDSPLIETLLELFSPLIPYIPCLSNLTNLYGFTLLTIPLVQSASKALIPKESHLNVFSFPFLILIIPVFIVPA